MLRKKRVFKIVKSYDSCAGFNYSMYRVKRFLIFLSYREYIGLTWNLDKALKIIEELEDEETTIIYNN